MRSEALWIAAGRIGNAILLLLSLRVMTTLLVPAEYAVLALLTAFQSFAGLILINPVGQYLNRHTHEWHDDGSLGVRLRALSRYWLVAGGVTGVMATGWFALTRPGQIALEHGFVGLGVWLTIFAITQQGVAVNRLNMLGFRQQSVLWQLASTTLGLLFSFLLTYIQQPSALAWLAGQGMGAWLGYLGARRALHTATPVGAVVQEAGLKAMISRPDFKAFCLPLAVTTTLLWLEGNGYRFILERTWAPEVFAFFLLGLSVPAQMSALLESIIVQLVYPYFFRAVTGEAGMEQKVRAVASMVNALWPLYLLWVTFLIVGAPYALRLIADPKYHGATPWLLVGALAELARLSGNAWQMAAQAEKDFAPMLKPFAVGALGVLGAALIVALFGLPPAVFAVLLVVALFAKTGFVVMAMRARMPITVAYRRVGLAACVLVISSLVFTQLPTEVGAWPAFVYLTLAFGFVAVPMAIHVKTSPAFNYLFSFQLRGGS